MPVTAPALGNAKFQDFVAETGYVTDAERLGDSFVAKLYLSEKVLETIDKKVPCHGAIFLMFFYWGVRYSKRSIDGSPIFR